MSSPIKPKPTQVIVLVIIAVIVGLVAWLMLAGRSSSPNSNGEYVGTLTYIDTSAMATDGPGVYELMSNQETVTVHLDAGESACDRNAIAVPDVKVGDTVQVKGDKGTDSIIRICEAGSYIKK